MRAIVLAAGRGTRLGELTRDTPKPLLCVGGKPLLCRTLEGMALAGITEAAVVTGYRGGQVVQALGDGSGLGIRITWIEQQELAGTGRALLLARDFVGDAGFLLAWGDIAVERENYSACVSALDGADGVLAVNEVDDPSEGAAVYIGASGMIERLVEKPAPGTSTTRWNNAGIGILPAAAWNAIAELEPSPRGEYELPDAVARLIAGGCRLRAVPIRGPWFDIGTPSSLAAARAAFGDNDC